MIEFDILYWINWMNNNENNKKRQGKVSWFDSDMVVNTTPDFPWKIVIKMELTNPIY